MTRTFRDGTLARNPCSAYIWGVQPYLATKRCIVGYSTGCTRLVCLMVPGGAQQPASPSYEGSHPPGLGPEASVGAPAFLLPYSPECMEGVFCELRLYWILRG